MQKTTMQKHSLWHPFFCVLFVTSTSLSSQTFPSWLASTTCFRVEIYGHQHWSLLAVLQFAWCHISGPLQLPKWGVPGSKDGPGLHSLSCLPFTLGVIPSYVQYL